jgi:hypothetical protein
MQFPYIEPPKRPNPATGMMQGMDVYSKILQAMAMPEMMKTQQDMAKAKLMEQQLANQYYPQATEADIGYKGAQKNLIEEQTKYLPLTSIISLQNAENARANASRLNSPATAASRLLRGAQVYPEASRDVWLAEHQGDVNKAMGSLTDQLNPENRIYQSTNYLNPDYLESFGIKPTISQQSDEYYPKNAPINQNIPGAPQGQLTLNPTPEQAQKLMQQNIAQKSPQTPEIQKNVPGYDPITKRPQITLGEPQSSDNWSPDEKIQWTAMDAANKARAGAQLTNRRESAIALYNVMREPDIQEAFIELANPKYLGMLGRSELELKKRFNPKEVAEYISIRDRLHTLLSGSLKGLEGLPTSEIGMRASGDFFKIGSNESAWKSDPQAALINTLSAYKLADAETRAIVNAAQPTYKTYNVPNSAPPEIDAALKAVSARQNEKNKGILQNLGIQKTEMNPVKTDASGKKMINFNGHWYSEDELK